MNIDAYTVLEWTYEPADLFEEPLEVEILSGIVHIDAGTARGTFPGPEYDRGAAFRDEAHRKLEPHFVAQQIVTGKKLQLDPAQMSREHPDGRRDRNVIVGTARLVIATHAATIDCTVHDADGRLISDSRASRLEQQRRFRDKVARVAATHPEINAMSASFQKSFDDEANCFVHLHEVLERLQSIFGSTHKAKSALGAEAWDLVGSLSNDATNAYGRHRGRALQHEKPDAKTIRRCRDAVRILMMAYVDQLHD